MARQGRDGRPSKREWPSLQPHGVSFALEHFRGGGVAAEEGDGSYQNQNEESEQPQLVHAGSKYAGAFDGPCSTFCECGCFQSDHQDAPNGSDQADDEEWLGNQIVRVDGDAHGVKNLDEHEHNEQLVQYRQRLYGNVPMSDALPKHLTGVGDGGERGYEKQYGQDGIDEHFGLAQIVAKVYAQLFFGHIRSPAESA